MASHPSVTRCDVSAPYRHTVTSRHTPLRGVTDVTCDAGVRDHGFHRRPYPPVDGGRSHISGEHQTTSGHFHMIYMDSIMLDPTCGPWKQSSAQPRSLGPYQMPYVDNRKANSQG